MKKFLSLCCALVLAGCASYRPMAGLNARLTDVRITEATPLETTLVFTMRIENENPVPVRLEGGVHKFFLNGMYVGKGMSGQEVVVPRFSSATQQVPVHLSNLALASQIQAMLERERVDFRLESILYGEENGRHHRMALLKQGALDARQFQRVHRVSQ